MALNIHKIKKKGLMNDDNNNLVILWPLPIPFVHNNSTTVINMLIQEPIGQLQKQY
jgi:hypothetical protein